MTVREENPTLQRRKVHSKCRQDRSDAPCGMQQGALQIYRWRQIVVQLFGVRRRLTPTAFFQFRPTGSSDGRCYREGGQATKISSPLQQARAGRQFGAPVLAAVAKKSSLLGHPRGS